MVDGRVNLKCLRRYKNVLAMALSGMACRMYFFPILCIAIVKYNCFKIKIIIRDHTSRRIGYTTEKCIKEQA